MLPLIEYLQDANHKEGSTTRIKKRDPRKEHSRTTGTQTKKATLNPKTKKPFCKETICDIFETECYDVDPLAPWVNMARL